MTSLLSGFTHSAYTFGNESQVTKMYPEMAQLAPGSLVRFLYKGVQFVEIEANLKEVCVTSCGQPAQLFHSLR